MCAAHSCAECKGDAMSVNIVQEIVERRKSDIEKRGFNFGFEIPAVRCRPVVPFMQKKGAILEVKRASPSKGDIAPDLDSVKTALEYRKKGAAAISCLTEENYFKGSLKELMAICSAIDDVAVLRKDFLIEEEEIEISYRCGADAVLLICGILPGEKLLSMTAKCQELGIRALVEVRTEEDVQKVLAVKKQYPETIVCGVNSRNLKDFSIDLLVPAMLKKRLGGTVIFESGITTAECAASVGKMGFGGILLGEFAARNPVKAGSFVNAFLKAEPDLYGEFILKLAEKIRSHREKNPHRPMVKICGLTRKEDVELAVKLGADFLGFIFASEYGRNVFGEKFNSLKEILSSIKNDNNVIKVAVITRPESSEAKEAVELVKAGVLDCIQVHGVRYADIPENIFGVPHYIAISGKNQTGSERLEELNALGYPRYLLDCKEHNYPVKSPSPLWIAGGITPENVSSLIKEFHPELVDVSGGLEDGVCGADGNLSAGEKSGSGWNLSSGAQSGVNSQPGIKNHQKMKDFFTKINEAEYV